MNDAVQKSSEWHRVDALPRLSPVQDDAWIAAVTAVYLRPGAAGLLRWMQALGLWMFATYGVLFAPIKTSGGKTLLGLLLCLDTERPLLLMPAKMISEYRERMRVLGRTWRIPTHVRIESFELLGTPQGADMLDRYKPTRIVADEAQKLRNPGSARTKRLGRYLTSNPECGFVPMSGTFLSRSIKDMAHLAIWAFGKPGWTWDGERYMYGRVADGVPLTRHWEEIQRWAGATDENEGSTSWLTGDDVDPGALLEWSRVEDERDEQGVPRDARTRARLALRRRIAESPGVVASSDGALPCSLVIESLPDLDLPELEQAFAGLRGAKELPDGTELINGLERWRHERTLGLGFFEVWHPQPPAWWREPRKLWAKTLRELLAHNRSDLDSASQIERAVLGGWRPDALPILQAWKEVEDRFEPETRIAWLSDRVMVRAAEHLRGPTIAWVEHPSAGKRLSQLTGLPYYRGMGLNDRGQHITKGEGPIIASRRANNEGRDLQYKWHRNLVVCPMSKGEEWEQTLARTHRDGQRADSVEVLVNMTCLQHWVDFERSRLDAKYQQDMSGQAQRLCYADILTLKASELPTENRWMR